MNDGSAQTAPLRTIIVGMDASMGAQRALAWAAARARETGARLVAVHVLTYSHAFATDLSLVTITNWRRNLEKDLSGPWTDAARAVGARVETKLVEDENPAAGIIATTERERGDLVVLGTHGRGNIADRILGATTYVVTHRSHAPVVIIPPHWHAAA
jgi:nucleotide-binding universal stress UspA family protein